MHRNTLHRTEESILYSLRHTTEARYSQLMSPTNLASDDFKFHLRKLVEAEYILKTDRGTYELTDIGKEFSNNLNKNTRGTQKQPKLSLLLVVSRIDNKGVKEFLFQKRLRQPFYGFWGYLSGPARWGEEFEETARDELLKQTGLSATFTVKSFLRSKDYAKSGGLLEDKLFIVLEGSCESDEPLSAWKSGETHWLTREAILAKDKIFSQSEDILKELSSVPLYQSKNIIYDSTQY